MLLITYVQRVISEKELYLLFPDKKKYTVKYIKFYFNTFFPLEIQFNMIRFMFFCVQIQFFVYYLLLCPHPLIKGPTIGFPPKLNITREL